MRKWVSVGPKCAFGSLPAENRLQFVINTFIHKVDVIISGFKAI